MSQSPEEANTQNLTPEEIRFRQAGINLSYEVYEVLSEAVRNLEIGNSSLFLDVRTILSDPTIPNPNATEKIADILVRNNISISSNYDINNLTEDPEANVIWAFHVKRVVASKLRAGFLSSEEIESRMDAVRRTKGPLTQFLIDDSQDSQEANIIILYCRQLGWRSRTILERLKESFPEVAAIQEYKPQEISKFTRIMNNLGYPYVTGKANWLENAEISSPEQQETLINSLRTLRLTHLYSLSELCEWIRDEYNVDVNVNTLPWFLCENGLTNEYGYEQVTKFNRGYARVGWLDTETYSQVDYLKILYDFYTEYVLKIKEAMNEENVSRKSRTKFRIEYVKAHLPQHYQIWDEFLKSSYPSESEYNRGWSKFLQNLVNSLSLFHKEEDRLFFQTVLRYHFPDEYASLEG